MREWCKAGGHTVAAVRAETHHRYMLKSRPALRQIIEECRQGPLRPRAGLRHDPGLLQEQRPGLDRGGAARRGGGSPAPGLRRRARGALRRGHQVHEGGRLGRGSGAHPAAHQRGEGEAHRDQGAAPGPPRPLRHVVEPRSRAPAVPQGRRPLPATSCPGRTPRRTWCGASSGSWPPAPPRWGCWCGRLNAEGIPAPAGGHLAPQRPGVPRPQPRLLRPGGHGAHEAPAAGPGGGRGVGARAPRPGRLARARRRAAPPPGEPGGRGRPRRPPWRATPSARRPPRGSRRGACCGAGGPSAAGCRAPHVHRRAHGGGDGGPGHGAGGGGRDVLPVLRARTATCWYAVEAGLQEACPARACIRADVLDHAVWRAVLDWTPPPPTPERTRGERAAREAAQSGCWRSSAGCCATCGRGSSRCCT